MVRDRDYPCALVQVYGSSGRLKRPVQGTLRGYSACLPREHPENRNIKTIANMAYVERNGGSSHMFLFLVRALASSIAVLLLQPCRLKPYGNPTQP